MFLRNTYFNTKRFLKRTIQSFKSYFPGGYQRLPKTPPCNPFSCTGNTTHFNHSYREPENTINYSSSVTTTTNETSNLIIKHSEVDSKKQDNKKKNSYGNHEKDEEDSSKCLVTKKLKELEMMDRNNVGLVLDIEEVLHYYSKLTCPVYRDIVEKFFVDIYSGTYNISRITLN